MDVLIWRCDSFESLETVAIQGYFIISVYSRTNTNSPETVMVIRAGLQLFRNLPLKWMLCSQLWDEDTWQI